MEHSTTFLHSLKFFKLMYLKKTIYPKYSQMLGRVQAWVHVCMCVRNNYYTCYLHFSLNQCGVLNLRPGNLSVCKAFSADGIVSDTSDAKTN